MKNEKELMENIWQIHGTLIKGMTGDEHDMYITLKNGKVIKIENYKEQTLEIINNKIREN